MEGNLALQYEWCVTFWRLGGKLWEYLPCVGQTGVPPTEEPIFVLLAGLTGALVGAGVKAGLAGWPQLWQGKLEENPVGTVLFSAVSWRPEILPLVVRFFAVSCRVRTCSCTCCTNCSCLLGMAVVRHAGKPNQDFSQLRWRVEGLQSLQGLVPLSYLISSLRTWC